MSYITRNGKRVVEDDLFVEGLVEQFFENEHREFYIESMKECLEEIYFGCDLEIQKYEEKIHHLADQNIQIDLDDGVKHNYELFADVLAKIK